MAETKAPSLRLPLARYGVQRSTRQLVLALLASTLMLTLGDQFHVQYGVIHYPAGGLVFGQSAWVAPGFALAVVGFCVLAWRYARHAHKAKPKEILADGLWFFASYAASGVIGGRVIGLTSLFIGLWLYRIARHPDRHLLIPFSVLLAFAGTLGEILLNATPLVSYTRSDIVNVPAWLPALYLQGAPLALGVTRWLQGDPPVPPED